MAKLYAIDSMAILYRSYFAMIRSPLMNSKGLNTSGVFGFLNQIVKIIEEDRPEYLAVTSDSSEPTFRHKQFPAYKATREKMPEDLVAQLPYLQKLIEALGLPYVIRPGYEADDIIGTLMRICGERSIQGVMVTSDKDYMQLITDDVVMLNHKQEKVGKPGVLERFECAPEQVIEVLGLMGDASDNIPGVRGIGEKTAIKLIRDYGTMKNVYANLDQISGKKLKENLENGRESAFLSRALVTIDCQVPLEFELEHFRLRQSSLTNNPRFLALLEDLEFKTLLKKYSSPPQETVPPQSIRSEASPPKIAPNPLASAAISQERPSFKPPASGASVAVYSVIQNLSEFDQFLAGLNDRDRVAFDLELQTPLHGTPRVKGAAFSKAAQSAIYLPLDGADAPDSSVRQKLKSFFENPAIFKIGSDLKPQLQALAREGMEAQSILSDVMVAGHLVDPVGKKDHTLDYLIQRQLNTARQHAPQSQARQLSMLEEAEGESPLYFCENADFCLRLHQWLQEQLLRTQMWDTYQRIEVPLIQVLARIELAGVRIDSDSLAAISHEFEGRLRELGQEIYQLAGEEFNINSVPELQKILYDKLALHTACGVKPKKIKLGNQMSTDEETLEKMQEHLLPRKLLEYRMLNKLKNTYLDQLPTFVNPQTGKIHAAFQQMVAATGRLSSEAPNLQNIPIRTAEGRRVRRAFIASSPEHVLISADYSQIELRIVAHYSKDPTFLEAYRKNQDIHALTASAIFNVPVTEVTREMRSRAKEVNFGLIYRMGGDRLSIVTQTSKTQAKAFIEKYFQKYSTIHALQEQFIAQAVKEGYSLTLMGRRRYLPEINAKGLAKALAEGAAINTPIQGSAAEIIKMAMIAIERKMKKEGLRSRMVLTVHDELVFDALKEEADALCPLIRNTMENVVALEVPLVVEIGQGANWLEAH